MLNNIKNTFFLLFFFTFIFLITKYYFSEENVIFTNKSRASYLLNINKENISLPVLKNDTNNIIVYKNDIEEFKKKEKKESGNI